MLDQIARWRGIFYACLIFAGLGFGAGILAIDTDNASAVFRLAWQLLLVGLLGSVIAMAAEAIVLELRAGRGASRDETPPAEEPKQADATGTEWAQSSTPETSPYGPPPSRKPPKLR